MQDLAGPALLTLGLVAVGGYLLGSIPFGVVLTRAAGAGDVRNIGSGNIGATNVLRTGRKDLAVATLILDAGKGAVALLIARHLLGSDAAGAIAGGAAFLGHLFPVWLGFKGGKGVATFFGLILAAWAELVVIIRAKRGLAMAHKVEVSHGADVGPWPLAALSCLRPGGAWVTADWFAFPRPASGLRCGHGLALG